MSYLLVDITLHNLCSVAHCIYSSLGLWSLFLQNKKWQINKAKNWTVVSKMFLLIIQNIVSKKKKKKTQFRSHHTIELWVWYFFKKSQQVIIFFLAVYLVSDKSRFSQPASCDHQPDWSWCCRSCNSQAQATAGLPPWITSPWQGAAIGDWGRAACCTEEWACQSTLTATLAIAVRCV